MGKSEPKECTCNRAEIDFWSYQLSNMFSEKIVCVDEECPIHGGEKYIEKTPKKRRKK